MTCVENYSTWRCRTLFFITFDDHEKAKVAPRHNHFNINTTTKQHLSGSVMLSTVLTIFKFKENFSISIMENAFVCFPAKRELRKLIPLSCLCAKYEATNWQLHTENMTTGSHCAGFAQSRSVFVWSKQTRLNKLISEIWGVGSEILYTWDRTRIAHPLVSSPCAKLN